MKTNTILKELSEKLPTFNFIHSIDKYGFETIENLTSLDYYITISEHEGVINNTICDCYNIVITEKKTGRQQMANSKTIDFVIQTLENLYYFGF